MQARYAFCAKAMELHEERTGDKGQFKTSKWVARRDTFADACDYYDLKELVPVRWRSEVRDELTHWVNIAVRASNEGRQGPAMRETAEETAEIDADARARAAENARLAAEAEATEG